jgi:hypothetical protein
MQPAHDSLPAVLKSVRTRPLFVMTLAIQPYLVVGETPGVNVALVWWPEAHLTGNALLER